MRTKLFNSNSIFIALNLHLKINSRCTIQKKQKNIMINRRHHRGQHHGKRLEKTEIRVDMLLQRDRCWASFWMSGEKRANVYLRQIIPNVWSIKSKAEAKMLSRLTYWSGKVWELKQDPISLAFMCYRHYV